MTLSCIFDNRDAKEPVFSIRKKHDIEICDWELFLKRINGYLKPLSSLPKQSLVLISKRLSIDTICSYIACMCCGLKPGFIAPKTIKVSDEDYGYKVEKLIQKFSAVAAVVDEHDIGYFSKVDPKPQLIFPVNSLDITIPLILDDCKFIQFSSGSTGVPKAIEYSFSTLCEHVQELGKITKVGEDSVFVSWLPLYHDMGFVTSFMMPLILRKMFHLIEPLYWVSNPAILWKDCEKMHGTHSWMPNFAYKLLADKVSYDGDLSSLKCLGNCAEPVTRDVVNAFYQKYKTNGLASDCLSATYAMAENIFCVSHCFFDLNSQNWSMELVSDDYRQGIVTESEDEALSIVSCGLPMESVDVKIKADKGQDIGEVLVRSSYTVESYYPDTPILDEEGYYNTKDQGFIRDGELYICGRTSDMLIIRGVNLFPQEIENVMSGIDGVYPGRVACFGVYNKETATEKLVLMAETKGDVNLSALESEIAEKASRWAGFAPDEIHLVPRMWLRKTSSGKISRSGCREKYLEYSSKKIHVLGCSHVYSFNQSEELYNQETTAKNIVLKQIPVVSSENVIKDPRKQEIENYLAEIEDGSLVILLFGEQDVRNVIPFYCRTKNMDTAKAVDFVINQYNVWLQTQKRKYPNLEFGWLLSPPPGEGLPPHPRFLKMQELTDEVYYHYQGDWPKRIECAKEFRKKLHSDLEVPVVDIWDEILCDGTGLSLNEKYIRDKSHLKNVRRIYERYLQSTFGYIVQSAKIPDYKIEAKELTRHNAADELRTLIYCNFGFSLEHGQVLLSCLNSLDIVQLFVLLQSRYRVKLPSEWMDRTEIETFGQLVDWVLKYRY
jgi:acyl-CoA synthetase (AMP-forming)/AMP-acid ligase II